MTNAGYLVANPFRSVMKGFELPKSKMDIRRSFTEAEWAHIQWHLQTMTPGRERVRVKCMLELLVTSGVRLDELASARHRDLREEALADLPPSWVLTVTGKRGKTREVPLQDYVVRLLAEHGHPYLEDDRTGPINPELGLIRTLRESVPKWAIGAGGELVAVPESATVGAPLSAAGIYMVLKRFFKAAAKTSENSGLDPARFEKASTHWMRHTFVRNALVDGVPIEIVSELVGHESIDTTSIYSTQELARKINALKQMKRRE